MIKREDKSYYIIEIRNIDNIIEMIEANINFDYNKRYVDGNDSDRYICN